MLEKCPNCGEIVESVALLSNPPIYKKICKNCGEITPTTTNTTYEVGYRDSDGRNYITTANMDLITATEVLKEYSKKYENCRLLETTIISKEVHLNIDEL